MKVVACVYWEGEFRGRELIYTPEWVYKLKRMTIKNMPADEAFRFVCFTNVPEKFDNTMETIPLIRNWEGWWSKLELFRADVFEEGTRVLYLDLDSLVVKNLEPIINFDAPLAMFKGLHTKYFGTAFFNRQKEYVVVRYSSTAIVWTVPAGREFYEGFDYNKIVVKKHIRGDQDWMAMCNPTYPFMPAEWISKIKNLPEHKPKKDNIIVVPMQQGMPDKNVGAAKRYGWVRKIWV